MNSIVKKIFLFALFGVVLCGSLFAQDAIPVLPRYGELRGNSITLALAIIILILTYKPVFKKNYRFRYLGYLIPSLVVCLTIILLYPVYHYFTTGEMWSEFMTVTQSIIMSIAMILIIVVYSSLLFFSEKFLIKNRLSFSVQLGIKLLLTLFWFIGPWAFINLLSGTGLEQPVNLYNFVVMGLIITTARGSLLLINEFSDSLVRKKDVELSQLKAMKAQAEMESLHARINPHFLYNSLNSIAGLARSNPEKTEQMALSLSELFRYHTNRNGDLLSTVEDELSMVRTYLNIEQIRFGERLHYSIEADSSVEKENIPRHILQPLVENAIKHGVSKIEGQGQITVAIRKTPDGITMEVIDNGPEFPEGLISGYGLQSIHDMLHLMYGEKAGILWENNPIKRILVSLPI